MGRFKVPACRPSILVEVMSSTSSHSIALGGENALPRYDDTAYGKIESYKSGMEVALCLRFFVLWRKPHLKTRKQCVCVCVCVS